MGRLLAGGLAIAAVAGAAVAIWLVWVDPEEDGAASPRPRAERAERAERPEPAPKAGAERRRFTIAASGDLLMHQPLLDRALSNGGGEKYDFAPFFGRIRPYLEKRADLALCHAETPMGPGPPATYPCRGTS